MSPPKSLALFLGAVVLLGAGVLLGKFLFSSGPRDLGPGSGSGSVGGPGESHDPDSPGALRKRIRDLETELAASTALNRKLIGKAEAEGKGTAGKGEDWAEAKKDWAAKKGSGRGKGKKGGWGKKGKKGKLVRPEGMTREEQDALVQKLVDGHDWAKTAAALRIWTNSEQGGRAVSMQDKEAIGEFFGVLGRLAEAGVDFFDRRVARRFVPAMVNQMGTNLDSAQADRVTTVVDDLGRRAETEPEPDPPRRYAHQKARDLQQTLDLEQQMQSILRPEQVQAYLDEVGNDPYRSGFGFKTSRMSCTGANTEAVVAEVTRIWMMIYELDESVRQQVTSAAHRFVSQALAVPEASTSGDASAQRRAVIQRTIRILELQGNEEQALLTAVCQTEESRRNRFERTCPVLDLVVE